jgi:phage terminase small subunit
MAKIKLTAKQEKFCQAIADGKTAYDAYNLAYDADKMKSAGIYVAASRMLDKTNIQLRIEELKKAIEKKYLWTREMSIQILGSIALKPSTLDNNKIAAIKELNAMHGFNEPKKYELAINPLVLILENDEGAK